MSSDRWRFSNPCPALAPLCSPHFSIFQMEGDSVEERRFISHYLFRALILGGFSWFIVRLVKSGNLSLYIAPRMEIYVKYAAIGFFVIAASQAFMALWSLFHKVQTCECEHVPPRSFWLNGLFYSLFILPLLLGMTLPDAMMGSNVAAMKGMNLTASAMNPSANGGINKLAAAKPPMVASDGGMSAVPNAVPSASPDAATPAASVGSELPGAEIADPSAEPAKSPDNDPDASKEAIPSNDDQGAAAEEGDLKKRFPADMYSEDFARLGMKLYAKKVLPIKEEGFTELLTTIDMYKDNFMGKTMEISGFVYREPDMAANQFVVARLVMQCCSADAMPYGVLVESDQAKNFDKDTWVQLSGTIGKTTYNDNEIMKLDALQIDIITAPETPYVNFYFDDYDKLAD